MPELQIGGVETFVARLPELLDVYRQAFLEVYETNPAQATRDRHALMLHHQHRTALRLALAEDATHAVVGFCYTYRSLEGQWWHDIIDRALPREVRRTWLEDCREVVELHVLPAAQGAGLGRELLRAALSEVSESTAVLSALDLPDTRARRLYASEGFAPLLTGFCFPSSIHHYAILGKRLTSEADHSGGLS